MDRYSYWNKTISEQLDLYTENPIHYQDGIFVLELRSVLIVL